MRQRLIYMAPVYPVTAPVGVSGTVVLNIVVDCTGKVISDTVASGSDPMASASVTAVNNWTYQPYLVNGTVVQVQTTVTLTFGQGKY
jgi:TonB family protein